MPTTHITFAKLAANPTPSTWSLAYNAGNLFAAFSLTRTEESDETLSGLGKNITNILQSEVFPIEKKNLQTIQEAIEQSIKDLPETIQFSGCIAFIKDSIVYVYRISKGQSLLHRAGTTAALFTPTETSANTITAVSGFLQSGDILVLATSSFITTVPSEQLTEAFSLQLPSDMAELITPTLHKSDDGTPAAIILTFASSEGQTAHVEPPANDEGEEIQSKELPIKEPHTIHPSLATPIESAPERVITEEEEDAETLADRIHPMPIIHPEPTEINTEAVVTKSRFSFPKITLPRKNLFFLTIAVGLALILIISIVTTKQNQGDSKAHAAFVELYNDASKSYQEGEGLVSLNKSLAQDDFKQAKETLDKAKAYVKSGTADEKSYTELAAKLASVLTVSEQTTKVTATEASTDASPALSNELSENAVAVTEDTSYVYILDTKTVTQIDKGNDKAKTLVTNDSDWKSPQAIAVYLSNIYILDKGNTILKFVAGTDGYGKSTYFKENTPSLAKTISMSIDSSVWLLDSDGAIRKFTKGTADSFTVSGLPTPFTSPKKLYTSVDTDNLYVLDSGNSKVVKLDKAGAYISSYASDTLKSATDFIVSEKDKKIYFIANKKIWQINLD